MANPPSSDPTAGGFAPTRWTLVLQARGELPEARVALGELCEAYYEPVLLFLQREGRSAEVARELAHGFFLRVLAGDSFARVDPACGRFRSFLLGALRHFLADQRDRETAIRRGGGARHEPLVPDDDSGDGLLAMPGVAPPADAWFDRQWALVVTQRAMAALAAEHQSPEKARRFELLRPWLAGSAAVPSPEAVQEALGWSAGTLKVHVHRLRQRFRELVREEVAQTVPGFADVKAELHYLVEVLAQPGSP